MYCKHTIICYQLYRIKSSNYINICLAFCQVEQIKQYVDLSIIFFTFDKFTIIIKHVYTVGSTIKYPIHYFVSNTKFHADYYNNKCFIKN